MELVLVLRREGELTDIDLTVTFCQSQHKSIISKTNPIPVERGRRAGGDVLEARLWPRHLSSSGLTQEPEAKAEGKIVM